MYDIIKYNGAEYIAQGWNGEYYGECYKRAGYCLGYSDTFSAPGWENKSIALKPIYKEIGKDEFEIVGYMEV